MKNIFSFSSVTYAITGLLVVYGLMGNAEMAADIGIAHGATLATFYAFSANARAVILAGANGSALLFSRLLLLVPLCLASYLLSVTVAGADAGIAVAIILRRAVEWINEIHLSEAERQGQNTIVFGLAQVVLFLLAVLSPTLLYLWALAPLLYSLPFVWRNTRVQPLKGLMPHFGSTAVMGTCIYAFRLLILLIAGKATAGLLYAAFAIGSFVGSFFANVAGPSLAAKTATIPKNLSVFLWGLVIVGTTLFFAPSFFWQTVGVSLVGGAIMVVAQQARLRLLKVDDVFGQDAFSHLLLIFTVPYAFFIAGVHGLMWLYLVNAVLAYVFYRGAEMRLQKLDNAAVFGITVALLMPLFFQLSGGIYHSVRLVVDSGGNLATLPLPIAVLACYGGILVLGRYNRAYLGIAFITALFFMMLASAILTAGDLNLERRKILLLLQFLLPAFALVLGQMVYDNKAIARAFLYTLALIVPAQLISTWLQGRVVLTHNLYIFSVYQHFQYVPMILVSAFIISLTSLWETHKKVFFVLSPFMAAYAAAGNSTLALFALLVFVAGFGIYRYRKARELAAVGFSIATVLIAGLYFNQSKSEYIGKYDALMRLEMPVNVVDRIADWTFYSKGILESAQTFSLGHSTPPPREVNTNAHNYYLDLVYNFGAISVIPILLMIAYTLFALWRSRDNLPGEVWWLAAMVLYLVIIDNNFKVSLRQPYAGIITYFLWGVLLSRIIYNKLSSDTTVIDKTSG